MRRGSWSIVVVAVAFAAALGAHAASAGVDARLMRYPDVSAERIAFVYAGDIWVVDRDGGPASRLSSPPGEEAFPRFSPDGGRIAFTGNYDGNSDVYVIPATGGTPHRVTHHPEEDRLLDWTPDGDGLLLASGRTSPLGRLMQLYTVSAEGGLPKKLPPPYGEFGALSPDGRVLAYTPKGREYRNWKRYRGGLAPDIWLLDLETLDARNISDSDANDMQPMWYGDTLYFLSDRGPAQRLNLWAVGAAGGTPRQVTRFTDFDVTWPAIGPDAIVFQAGGRLWLLDLATEKAAEVDVDVVTDLSTVRPRRVNVGDLVAGGGISPSGKRAVIEARGNVYTVPAEHGPIRQLTATSGVAERYPAWSPDGEHVAYWSDASGEYELVLQAADGSGEPETVTSLGPGYRYRPMWSPDSGSIAFLDHTATIRVLDLDSRELVEVDRLPVALHGGRESFEVSWSADSRWIAYSRGLDAARTAVFVFDTDAGTRHQLTSGSYSDSSPWFDPAGKYLYYLSDRDLSPVYSDLDSTWVYPNTTVLMAGSLRDDVPSPLAPRNDEEEGNGEDEGGDDAEKGDAGGEKDSDDEDGEPRDDEAAPEPVEIDLEGFEGRIVQLPVESGNFGELRAVEGKVVYRRTPRKGAADGPSPVKLWDLEEREESTVLDDADGFGISADGKKMIAAAGGTWAIVDVAPGQKLETPLRLGELETVLDPRAEWRQIFTDVWRTYRDIFYDPTLHGLDWDALRERYGALIDDAVTRWDVNVVIGELIGEVNASHTYVGGGDVETPRSRQVGLLGVDWELSGGAYRIARILEAAPWDAGVRSPLAAPGVDVAEGDYVLAVNGRPLDPARDPYAPFEGLAGEAVLLTVNDRPTADGAREVLVETLRDEGRLRYLEWVEDNRRRVEELSDGRIGYVFVPDTGIRGQTELVRQFQSQLHHDGLIVDERFNGGGQIPDRFVELISRPKVSWISFRHGENWSWPPVTHVGPKAMLINGWAGSGGDAFPFIFKYLDVGPLVGERTWGGLIGPATGHALIDGGGHTAPQGRFFVPGEGWFPEGHGVDPDVPVIDHPGAMAKGGDPQLEKGVEVVLEMLERNPPSEPEAPPFESRVP